MKSYQWTAGSFTYRVNDQEATDDPPALEFKEIEGDKFYNAKRGPLWPFSREMIRLKEEAVTYVLESVLIDMVSVIDYAGGSLEEALKLASLKAKCVDRFILHHWKGGKRVKLERLDSDALDG